MSRGEGGREGRGGKGGKGRGGEERGFASLAAPPPCGSHMALLHASTYAGMCPRWSAVVGIGHHSKVADRHSSPPTTYLAAATDFRLGIKRLEIVTTVRLAVAACRTSSRTRTTALTARKRGHYNLQRAQLLFILSILPVFSQLFLNNALCSATTIII